MSPDQSRPMRWGGHYKGISDLADLQVVESPAVKMVRMRMMETIELGGMMRVSGPVGHGKSFATARAAEACEARYPDISVTWVEVAGTVRGRGLAALLYEQVLGTTPPSRASLAQLRAELLEHLAGNRHLIICDEAQHVSNEAMHLIRWMYDAPGTNLVVVFCGVAELRHPYPPEIRSRLISHVEFEPIIDDDAPRLLRSMHPLFERVPDRIIKHANKREARGEWRWWCKFLARAALYLDDDQPIELDTFNGLTNGLHRS